VDAGKQDFFARELVGTVMGKSAAIAHQLLQMKMR
jgi:hypothetical protein